MEVKFYRRRKDGPGQEYVMTAMLDTVPRQGDWISFNPDDASEVADHVTFVMELGRVPYALVVTR